MKLIKRFIPVFVILTMLIGGSVSADSANTDQKVNNADEEPAFPIGVFWIPFVDKINDESMQEIKDMNANFILPIHHIDMFDRVDYVLDYAEKHGLKVLVHDYRIDFLNGNKPSDELMIEIAEHYKDHPALLGYDVFDEPQGDEALVNVKHSIDVLKAADPNHMAFVNLTGYFDNFNHTGIFRPLNGEYVTPSTPLGQTFRTKPDEREIKSVQLYLDRSMWTGDEKLTVTIWDSPAKNKKIDSTTLSSEHSKLFPTFEFSGDAKVKGDTEYYWELTHEGGGDNSVGWVIRTEYNDEWNTQGTGYVNGTSIPADFLFHVNSSFYETNYVAQWAGYKPDVLSFDSYPFMEGGGASDNMFRTMEIIRRHALLNDLDIWSYMQSVGIHGSLRAPNEGEMRYQLYANLAYGVKGIMYFTYMTPYPPEFHDGLLSADGTKNESYYWAKQFNADLLKLGPTLKKLTSQAVYHTGGEIPATTVRLPDKFDLQPSDPSAPYIIGQFEHVDGHSYVMIVNKDYANPREAVFTFKKKPKFVEEISKVTGQSIDTNYDRKTGTLTFNLAPGEGKLFKLPENYFKK